LTAPLGSLPGAQEAALRKGLSTATFAAVAETVRDAADPLSAGDLGDRLGEPSPAPAPAPAPAVAGAPRSVEDASARLGLPASEALGASWACQRVRLTAVAGPA
jgi:hypothetical protein